MRVGEASEGDAAPLGLAITANFLEEAASDRDF